ncbi:MAG: hypothetical protein AAFZ80_03795 [Cyanobacteria bacterium P01_A01_bin.105]
MTHSSSRSHASPQSEAELALLQTVLDEETAYPWAMEQASEYAAQAAEAHSLDFTEAEADQGWTVLSQQLDAVWSETMTVEAALLAKFAGRLSASVADHIAATAQQVARSGRPLAEQMIACVRDTLASWDEADLQVMARPMAFAMRGQAENIDAAINSVRDVEWESLNEMEQARISLAAARYALDQIETPGE